MAKQPLIKCKPDDPQVCPTCLRVNESTFYKVVKDQTHCSQHGGARQASEANKVAASQYRLEIWQGRLDEFSGSDQVKSLREEIGILRMTLEATLQKCGTQDELMMYSAKISDLATKIEKLVTACHRIEVGMGDLMDKPTAIKFAGRLLEIISTEVKDADVLDIISHAVLEEMRRI